MTDAPALVLDAERDRIALIRLRTAVREDFGRSAMIYAAADLATWIGRSLERRGLGVTVTADGDGLVIQDGDAEALAAITRATATGSFDRS